MAEERKWRLRLEQIEASLTRCSEDQAVSSRKVFDLEERTCELQRGFHGIQSAEGRIQEALKEGKQLRQSFEKQAEELQVLEQQQQMTSSQLKSFKVLESSLGALEKRVGGYEESLQLFEKASKELVETQRCHQEDCAVELGTCQRRLCGLEEQVGSLQRSCGELTKTQRGQKEELLSVTTSIREMEATTMACRTEALSLESRMEGALHRLQEVSRQVLKQEEQACSTSASMQSLQAELRNLEDGLSRASTRVDHHHDALDSLNNRGCAMESRLGNLQEDMLKKFLALEREVGTHEMELTTMQDCLESLGDKLQDLEGRLSTQDVQLLQSSASMMELKKQVATNERGLTTMQDCQESQAARMEDLQGRTSAQEEQVQQLSTGLEELKKQDWEDHQELQRLAEMLTQQGLTHAEAEASFKDRLGRCEDDCKSIKEETQNTQEQLLLLEGLTKNEHQRSCTMEEKLQEALEDLSAMRACLAEVDQIRSELEAVLEDSKNWREAMERMECAIQSNVSKEEQQQMHSELQSWMTDTRQALDRWLSVSLERFQKEQGWILQRNLGSVARVKRWIEQIHIREQGLSHVILHITQQASPETMRLLEEALKMPKKPEWPDLGH